MLLRTRCGFTLVELLVVIAVVSVLMGLLAPAMHGARDAARRTACLANMRSLEQAHLVYVYEHHGELIGSAHGTSWIETLRGYDPSLLLRSPVDTSPHFPGGTPVDGAYRQSSYSINFFLSPDNPDGTARLDLVPTPTVTAHFVITVFEGPRSVRDHVHPQLWASPIPDLVPAKAAAEVQTNAHGGAEGTWDAVSNYGYLDGHAAASTFRAVYTDRDHNRFDPDIAH